MSNRLLAFYSLPLAIAFIIFSAGAVRALAGQDYQWAAGFGALAVVVGALLWVIFRNRP